MGNTWSTEADVFTYPGLEFQFTVDVAFQVVEEGILATPAGSFHAFGIGQEKPSPGVSEFALNGERSTTGPVAATRWYNDGVGPIQYVTDQLYQLEFFNLPVSIAAVSWGRVKSLYR